MKTTFAANFDKAVVSRILIALFFLCDLHIALAQKDIALDNWQPRSSITSYDLEKVIFVNGIFIAVGYGGTVLSSPDGIEWAKRSEGSHVLKDIAYGNGVFVAVGGSGSGPGTTGKIWTSADLENWTEQTTGDISWRYSIAFGNGIFVAGGNAKDIQISSDGVTWNQTNWPGLSGPYVNSITFGNSKFIAVSAKGEIGSSLNGDTWSIVTPFGTATAWWQSVTYGDGFFVVVASSSSASSADIATSLNGTDWATRMPGESRGFGELTWGNGFFVCVGRTGQIYTSQDGITWVRRNSGASENLFGIAYGNGTFLAVGQNGRILQSGCMAFELGDLNQDCKVDLADCIASLQVASGIAPSPGLYKTADVNADGKIDIVESIYILQSISGIR